MLFGFEVFPLFQHLGVKLQLVITLGMRVAMVVEYGNQIVEDELIHALVLVFGLDGDEHEVHHVILLESIE